MYLRNCWYMAAWPTEVTSVPLARKILGEQLVLYRKPDGAAVAMTGYCPHRLAPLEFGRVEGENIRCMYHGLVFNPSGRCIEIPGQGTASGQMEIRTYPLEEREGVLWVWMGDKDAADPALIHSTPWLDSPAWSTVTGYVHYDNASYRLIMDNLLDLSHLGFVHENTLGGGKVSAEVRAKVTDIDRGLRVDRRYQTPKPPYIADVLDGDIFDRWQIYNWMIEGNLLILDSGTVPAGSMEPGDPDEPLPAGAFRAISVQAVTPETETSSHYFYSAAQSKKLVRPTAEQTMRAMEVAFDEDKRMIQGQQAIITQNPGVAMRMIRSDTAAIKGARMLDAMIEAERASAAARSVEVT